MMVRVGVVRGVMVLGTLLLAACGAGPGEQRATADLNNRLQARLAPDIAAGRAVVQPLPDGARVTLTAPSNGEWGVGQGQDARVNTVQALLNPSLLRIELAKQTPYDEAMLQALSVMNWQSITQGDPSIAPPGGVVVTIHVVCPEDEPVDGRPGCR
jgi:hypothetical protein